MNPPRRSGKGARASAAHPAQRSLFDDLAPASDALTAVTPAADAAALLAQLTRWRDAGWLRALDLALARFLNSLDPDGPPPLLLAAALLAQLESHGHSALPLPTLAAEGAALFAWPPEAQAELAALLPLLPADADAAHAAWSGSRVLAIVGRSGSDAADPDPPEAAALLVLDGPRLYLRRYWRHEQRVARQLQWRLGPAAAEGALAQGQRPAEPTTAAILGNSPCGLPPPAADPGPPAQARALMRRLFPPRGGAGSTADGEAAGAGAVDWQAVACALALRGRVTVVTGGPGTGKTYTAARLLVLLQALHPGPEPLRVGLAAPTGKAAARLKQSLELALAGLPADLRALLPAAPPAGTLHQLLGVQPGTRRMRHHAAQPLALDLLFVDEASMVHLEMMDALLDALPPHTRLVLLGDRDQLASVEAGAVLAELCPEASEGYDQATRDWVRQLSGQPLPADTAAAAQASPAEPAAAATAAATTRAAVPPARSTAAQLAAHTVRLRESRRFAGRIGAVARAVNAGDAATLRRLLVEDGAEALCLRPADPAAAARCAVEGRPGAIGLREALSALAQRPAAPEAFTPWALRLLQQFERCRVLCALREGPWGVAELNAHISRQLAQTGLLQPRGEWYEGRPVMVTRNAPALGVFNGDIGLVLGGPALRAWFLQGDALHSVSVARLPPVETAFALTVHKSQGSEFEHVLLVLPDHDSPVLSRELLYTGITRAKSALTLLAPEPARLNDACARLTRRLSGLGQMLRR